MVSRECPACERGRVISRDAAYEVYTNATDVIQYLERNPDVTHVCSYCQHPIRRKS